MLTLTEAAATAIRDMLDEQGMTGGGLRFSAVEEDGEIALELSAERASADGDETVEEHGVRVFLDADAADALSDQTLDVEPHGDHVHFTFVQQT